MIRTRKYRRTVGALLIVGGAVLMWLAPESLAGAVLLAVAIGLEVAGLRLERAAKEP
jgi:hypothetical protein